MLRADLSPYCSYKPRRQRTKPVDVRMSRSRIGADGSGSVDFGKGQKLLQLQGGLASPPPPPVPALSQIVPGALPPPSAPTTFMASPISGPSPVEEAPPAATEVVAPGPPVLAPTAPVAEAQPEEPKSPDPAVGSAPSRGSGSLTRREGIAGVRRGARGPRPLPSAASPEAPASALPPQVVDEESEDARARSASFTRTKPGMESDA